MCSGKREYDVGQIIAVQKGKGEIHFCYYKMVVGKGREAEIRYNYGRFTFHIPSNSVGITKF